MHICFKSLSVVYLEPVWAQFLASLTSLRIRSPLDQDFDDPDIQVISVCEMALADDDSILPQTLYWCACTMLRTP
jgi:hypothetical protein